MTGNGERMDAMKRQQALVLRGLQPGMRTPAAQGDDGTGREQYITKLTLNTAQAHFNEQY